MRNTIYLLLIGFLIVSGCAPKQDSLDGLWQIESFKENGNDRLKILANLNFGNEMLITFPDPSDQSGQWSITEYKSDTSYVILGLLNYKKPILNFSNTYAFITVLGPGRGQFIAHTLTDSAYRAQIPLNFFDGDWKIVRKGRNSLELIKESNREIELHLRRQ